MGGRMKDTIVVHNLRLNLAHEEEYAIYRALMNYNKDIYKSKSDFHKRRLYAEIYGERDYAEEDLGAIKQKNSVSMDELKEIMLNFKAEIMKEISEMVISLFMDKIFAHLPLEMVGSNAVKSEQEVDDEVEAAACKYFDGI